MREVLVVFVIMLALCTICDVKSVGLTECLVRGVAGAVFLITLRSWVRR